VQLQEMWEHTAEQIRKLMFGGISYELNVFSISGKRKAVPVLIN
jgi:hypothetical protein